MDSIEKAIRSAFAKGDPADRAFREKVYRSAFGALDRNLKSNPNMTEAIAQRRREALLATVTAIETEFGPARPANPPTPPPMPVAPDAPAAAPPAEPAAPVLAPTLDGERRPSAPREADISPDMRPDRRTGILAGTPKRRGGRARPRRRFRLVGLLLFLLLLGAVVAGLWWLAVSGTGERLLTPAQTGTTGAPRAAGDTLEGWVDIFTPADPTTVSAPGDSRAEVMEEDGERFIRLTSGSSGAPVLFDVGQGILEDIAGARAVFNIVASAREGEETQISVDCTLAELGDCSRRRYAVGATREEYLFEIDLPAARPGAGGTIAVNADVEGRGRAVDIHAIRVRAAR
jgi:hypothetical protein